MSFDSDKALGTLTDNGLNLLQPYEWLPVLQRTGSHKNNRFNTPPVYTVIKAIRPL